MGPISGEMGESSGATRNCARIWARKSAKNASRATIWATIWEDAKTQRNSGATAANRTHERICGGTHGEATETQGTPGGIQAQNDEI